MRPNVDNYFMQIVNVVASRSNCVSRKVGAVIVKDRHIISTGYNGTPKGTRNCNEGGCSRCAAGGKSGISLDLCICSHAEENAIVQAAYHGIKISGATIYTGLSPCLLCTKMIINAGIVEVVYEGEYASKDIAKSVLMEAKIKLRNVTTCL